jgi:2-succinyl-6-hydroxy-2,4-cyclohexadiene-1-carboxylate synthase
MIVLLHGFTHTGASWDPVVAELGARYRVIAPDIRGHGSASRIEPVSLEGVVDDLRRLEPAVLCGYSMGARLALHAALELPSVQRLVLIGGSPGLADRDERAARRAADAALADELGALSIEQVADRWAAETAVLAGQPAAVAAAARKDRLRNTPTGLARALRGLGTGTLPPLWDRLGEITVPVTLIVGERDAKFRSIAQQMAPRFGSHAEIVIVAGAGHAVHLEAPAAIASAIPRE